MAWWITVYGTRSPDGPLPTPEDVRAGIRASPSTYQALVEAHTLDVDVTSALAALTVEPWGERGVQIAYGAEHGRSVGVHFWTEPERVAEEVEEAMEVRRAPAHGLTRLQHSNVVAGIELGASQLEDMGYIVALQVARFLGERWNALVVDDDANWSLVRAGRLIVFEPDYAALPAQVSPRAAEELALWIGIGGDRSTGSVFEAWTSPWSGDSLSGKRRSDFHYWLCTLELWGIPVLTRGIVGVAAHYVRTSDLAQDQRLDQVLTVLRAWTDDPAAVTLDALDAATDLAAEVFLEHHDRNGRWSVAIDWVKEASLVPRIALTGADHRFNQGDQDPRRAVPSAVRYARNTDLDALHQSVTAELQAWLAHSGPSD